MILFAPDGAIIITFLSGVLNATWLLRPTGSLKDGHADTGEAPCMSGTSAECR